MNRRILIAFLLFLPHSALFAQTEASVRTLRTRSISFQVDKKIPEIFAHSVAAKPDAMGVPVNVKSYLNHEFERIPMSGDRLVFTTSDERSSITDPKQIVAKVKVPEKVRSAVLMFLPGTGKPGDPGYRILVIEDTTKAFPRGSFKVINLSPRKLRITLEKFMYDFEKGETKIIKNPPVNARNASAMRAFNYLDGQWQGIGSTSWPHPGKKRVIHVAFLNPASRKVELRGIRDIAVDDPVEAVEPAE